MRIDKAIKFMRVARFHANEFSKDRSRKIGCVIYDAEDFTPLTYGYNGMPRGCDDELPERHERPEKYFWFEHAERNAIYNHSRKGGPPLQGAIAVVTLMPCMDCARALAQVGISAVVTMRPAAEPQWQEHFARSVALFKELGIELVYLEEWDLADAWPTAPAVTTSGPATNAKEKK